MEVRFTVTGEPFGKPRHRSTRTGHIYRSDKDILYELKVREAWRSTDAPPFPENTALKISVYAYFAISKSVSKKRWYDFVMNLIRPKKKPDWDNIGKAVTDPLNKIAFDDDSKIVESHVYKYYAENPRVEVILEDVPG